MTIETIRIYTPDGFRLGATLYLPALAANIWSYPTIIGSATAVPQRYYGKFARYLADHGRPTLTFDYRGTGTSAPERLRGSKIRYRDWGIRDIPAVIDWMSNRFPGAPLHWVGHSYGGLATGLAENNVQIRRQLSVAAMSADVRYVEGKFRALDIGLQLFLLAPVAAHTIGYVPARLAGGVALPKHVALEWAKWVRTPDFLFGIDDLHEKANYAKFTGAIRFAFAQDDGWLSRRGVEKLAEKFVSAADRSVWTITHSEAGARSVGHLGFFRSDFAGNLWPAALRWLDGAPSREHQEQQ